MLGREFTTGSITGTGSTINVSLGFKPKYVKVFNTAKNVVMEWIDGMGNGKGVKDQDQAVNEGGTNTYTVGPQAVTSNGISAYDGDTSTPAGFTIGADTDLNVNGDTLYYIAAR